MVKLYPNMSAVLLHNSQLDHKRVRTPSSAYYCLCVCILLLLLLESHVVSPPFLDQSSKCSGFGGWTTDTGSCQELNIVLSKKLCVYVLGSLTMTDILPTGQVLWTGPNRRQDETFKEGSPVSFRNCHQDTERETEHHHWFQQQPGEKHRLVTPAPQAAFWLCHHKWFKLSRVCSKANQEHLITSQMEPELYVTEFLPCFHDHRRDESMGESWSSFFIQWLTIIQHQGNGTNLEQHIDHNNQEWKFFRKSKCSLYLSVLFHGFLVLRNTTAACIDSHRQ